MPLKENNSKTLNQFSEVVSSSNEVVIAQCYKENNFSLNNKFEISQGNIVKIISSEDNDYIVYGIVTKINYSSLDNIHRPSALGLNSKQLEELQPQVYELLRKEVEIYLFAYSMGGEIINHAPSKPMMLHDFVYFAEEKEIISLTSDLSNLISFLKKYQINVELIVNIIKKGYALRKNNYDYLVKAGKELSTYYSDDIETLMLTLKRISPKEHP